MTFKHLLAILSRHVFFIAALTALVVVPAAYLSLRQPDKFEASALLEVQPPVSGDGTIGIQELLAARERAVTITQLANTGVVEARTFARLPRTITPYECGFSQVEQSEFINVSCTSTRRNEVALLANRHATTLQSMLETRRQARIREVGRQHDAVIRQLRRQGVPPENWPVQPPYPAHRELTLPRVARAPTEPFAPNHFRTILIALVLGLIINSALAMLLEYAQDKARELDDFEHALAEPILATIPAIRRRGKLPAQREGAATAQLSGLAAVRSNGPGDGAGQQEGAPLETRPRTRAEGERP